MVLEFVGKFASMWSFKPVAPANLAATTNVSMHGRLHCASLDSKTSGLAWPNRLIHIWDHTVLMFSSRAPCAGATTVSLVCGRVRENPCLPLRSALMEHHGTIAVGALHWSACLSVCLFVCLLPVDRSVGLFVCLCGCLCQRQLHASW